MDELLKWHDAAIEKPDVDMTVLCWDSEGFFCGYWDDSVPGWVACESGGVVDGVTHWSIPEGPHQVVFGNAGGPVNQGSEYLDIPSFLRRQAD